MQQFVNIQVKRFSLTISLILAIALGHAASAGPAAVKAVTKTYYSSPIKEFRGATFFQWKKYEQAKVAEAKNAVEQPQQASQPTAKKNDAPVSEAVND